MVLATILFGSRPGWAELHVRMPTVEYRELEIEHNGLYTFDKKGSDLNGQQSYTTSIGYGVLPWWKIELEGEMAGGPGVERTFEATTIENWFQLTEPGKYFVNAAIFLEYSQATGQTNPNSFTFGPIIQKELNNVLGVDSLHTLNVFFSRDVGRGSSKATGFEYAWQSRLLLNRYIDPAIEFYSKLFATDLAKVRPGYANFAIAEPPLKLVLIETPGQGGTLNHLGVEVASTDEVVAAQTRLTGEGLTTASEEGVACCYARQDKVWVDGPSGEPWEIYTVLEDVEMLGGQLRAIDPETGATCCFEMDDGALVPDTAAHCC
jgi:hypothetical protein